MNSKIKKKITSEKKEFIQIKNSFIQNLRQWRNKKKLFIKNLNQKYGPLPAKSYPARACVIINYLGLSNKNIKNIFEKDISKKLNKYVPGTNIKIIGDKKFDKRNKEIPIINFSWHISYEIKDYLKKMGIKNRIIDIVEKRDNR